ncbi:chorismate--pyruvate lyase family protein [Nocardia xishanensis]
MTSVGAEELLRRHFQAPEARPTSWEDIRVAELSPYHRSVLLTDGTVIRTVEAHALESITVDCTAQYETTGTADRNGWLELGPGETVIARRVDLVGAHSETRYARAESLIVPARLPESFTAALAVEPAGIGAALQATESYRELLYYGATSDAVCARCYRIVTNGRPAMVIREWFLR